jgi:non-specific serine/threonine protein kinase
VVVDRANADQYRYRFLETVRHYARERLLQTGAADRSRDRHFEFFFNEFRGACPILRGHGQVPCLRRLRMEQENVRAGLEWALTSSALGEKGVELAGALFWFWTKSGLFEEGKHWLERAVALRAPGPLRARAIIGLSHMHYFQGHFAEVAACGAETLSLGRAYSDSWVVAVALFLQATAAFELGDYKQAAARAEEARQAANACGEALELGGPLVVLANLARSNGNYDRAQQLYDEAIEVLRHGGEVWALAILLTAAAGLSIVRDDLDQARAQASEAMSLSQDLEDPRGIACSLELFAGLMAATGRAESAAHLWGASEALLESVGGSLAPNVGWIRERYIEPMKTSVGDTLFEAARAEGRAMPSVKAIELALQQAFLVH